MFDSFIWIFEQSISVLFILKHECKYEDSVRVCTVLIASIQKKNIPNQT